MDLFRIFRRRKKEFVAKPYSHWVYEADGVTKKEVGTGGVASMDGIRNAEFQGWDVKW